MPWVAPAPTRGAAALLLWEDERRSAYFVLQRRRGAALRRQWQGFLGGGGGGAGVAGHRILLADKDGTVLAADEDAASTEREWDFLEERVVPQLQMAAVRFEDVMSLARGLFLAAHVFDRPENEELPRRTISGFVLKAWQIAADLVPHCRCWVRPAPSRMSAVYSVLYSNDFFQLQRNTVHVEQLSSLLSALGASAPAPFRIVLRTKEAHCIARAARLEELHAVWLALEQTLVLALSSNGVRPSPDWKVRAADMLVALFDSLCGAYIPDLLPPSAAAGAGMCVCVHVCACVCICVHTSACVCMCVHVCACVRIKMRHGTTEQTRSSKPSTLSPHPQP